MKTDTALIKAYLNTHITGKLTPSITDPIHLRQELLRITNSYLQDFPYLKTQTQMSGTITDSLQ